MNTYHFSETKRYAFAKDQNGQMWSRKLWGFTENPINKVQDTGSPFGFCDLATTNASSVEEAFAKYYAHRDVVRKENKAAREEYLRERADQIANLLSLPVIPVTVETIGLVLEYLSNQNWGSWTLPQMSIGYSAHMWECEGTTITTITLDSPIECQDRLVKKFKSGSKRGHLENYTAI